MLFKIIVIALLVFIFSSLGVGLYHLLHGHEASNNVVKSLTVRIGISVALFILIMVAYALGWVTPNPSPI